MRADLTPSMQQYMAQKAQYRDCILLFRMGDFYETFFEDAIEASKLLDIALTSRNKHDSNPIPMAGIPYHALDQYMKKLLSAGRKVAICEQMEDPKQSRGLVRREVVRVVTPGVLLESEIDDPSTANHLAALASSEDGVGIAVLDASTGDFQGATWATPDTEGLRETIAKLNVREILVLRDQVESLEPYVVLFEQALVTHVDAIHGWRPAWDDLVPERFRQGPLGRACAMVLWYLEHTHKALMHTVRPLLPLSTGGAMYLPQTTVRNLELLHPLGQAGRRASLFGFLNRTKTPMGARLLRQLLLSPLMDIRAIEQRLDRVQAFFEHPTLRNSVSQKLRATGDLERLLSRLAGGPCNARDLHNVASAIEAMRGCTECVREARVQALGDLVGVPDGLARLSESISARFVDDPPAATKEGGMVRRGVHEELDRARDLIENSRRYIAEYEAREREHTGIPNLRVKYNRVFGYTIEVTKAWQQRVPEHYVRRQTLTSAERYTTEELTRLEKDIAAAQERANAIELALFEESKANVLRCRRELQDLAQRTAWLDVYCALAEVAHEHGFCRPELHDGLDIEIRAGRHPIVEQSLPPGTFVPNDYVLDTDRKTLDIITGPNMAGKSTVMRQVALIVLLAQMGSFVPAEHARIGIADAIFTRIGAMDELARGMSTFMVEMSETAEILARATKRSLVVLDEVGRGTSTFDGLAIAWSLAEHIHDQLGCRTLFATHYHELTDLVRVLPKARNLNVAVKEWKGEVVFLRQLVEGPCSKSYGIQVAKLARLPERVLDRAREVLYNLEQVDLDATGRPRIGRRRKGRSQEPGPYQQELFAEPETDPLLGELAALDTDRMTPVQALTALADLVQRAREKKR